MDKCAIMTTLWLVWKVTDKVTTWIVPLILFVVVVVVIVVLDVVVVFYSFALKLLPYLF
jgi:hypothetical protein